MTSFWDAFVTKLRSCFYFCCPWARSSTPVDYQQQSSCNTSCYEAIQKDKTSHAIELNDVDYGAIPKVDVEASRGPTNHQFIRFSQQSKAEPGEKQLTEKALRELNRLDKTYKADEETTDKNIFPHPIDLTAIHPWLNTVAPMDEATSREMEYLVGTYEEEYEKIEKSVPPPSPGSLTPSLASYKSNKSAYHIDRIGGATQIRYSKTTEAEGSAQKDRGGVKYMKTGRTVKQRDRMPNLQQTDIILRTGVIDEPAKPPVFDQALQTGYRGDYSKTRRALDKAEKRGRSKKRHKRGKSSSSSSSDSSSSKSSKGKKKKKKKKKKKGSSSSSSSSSRSHKGSKKKKKKKSNSSSSSNNSKGKKKKGGSSSDNSKKRKKKKSSSS